MTTVWLMYHDVYEQAPRPGVPASASSYHVSRQMFADHLARIAVSGAQVVTPDAVIVDATAVPGVVLTFDDGWIGGFDIAVPMLLARGWRATFYVTRDFIGRKHFCTAATLRDAADAGMEIGVHGVTHRMLSACTRAEVVAEFRDCRQALEDLLGRPVRHASVPGGDYTATIVACAQEAGLTSLANSRPGLNRGPASPFDIRRLAVKTTTPPADVERWCRLDVGREHTRWAILEVPRAVLGMKTYSRLRRVVLGERGHSAQEVFKP